MTETTTIRGIEYEVFPCTYPGCDNGRVMDRSVPMQYRGSDGKVQCSRCSGLGVQYRRLSV